MSTTARFALLALAVAGCRTQHIAAEHPREHAREQPPAGPAQPQPETPAPPAPTPVPPGPPPEDRLVLQRVSFADLPGWSEDEVGKAIPALVRSCTRLRRLGDDEQVGRTDTGGLAGDWRRACQRAERVPAADHARARAFFEAEFVPFLASNNGDPIGRFTGYHEPLLHGSRRRHGKYRTPLYRRPSDLVMVDLSKFLDDARGRRLWGRVVGRQLQPFDTRADIVGGSLAGKKLELFWLDDPIDAFFVQVQGSGRVELENGHEIRVGYAATNGHRYTAIGRVLIEEGHLTRESVSMQSIRAYLESHPRRADEVMNRNESYVFFDTVEGAGPIGSQGVVLTAERSVAIDRNFIPQSAPLWLDTVAPIAGAAGEQPLRRLVIAQDTGGAILGPVRADVYWGGDDAAADVAGRMKSRGRYFLFLPVAAAARLPE
ncbi:MAG TPA: murein transglycosylase A [Kofleriaceae bacterium]|nr:murein transglycosylase A [Kofleriaceae bacterium]